MGLKEMCSADTRRVKLTSRPFRGVGDSGADRCDVHRAFRARHLCWSRERGGENVHKTLQHKKE